MTNIEVRTQNIYENLSNAEKKVASYFLDNVENVFAKPISQLAEESGVSKVAWVRFCKAIGFDGLKDLKKSLFSELHETAGEPAEAAAFSAAGAPAFAVVLAAADVPGFVAAFAGAGR